VRENQIMTTPVRYSDAAEASTENTAALAETANAEHEAAEEAAGRAIEHARRAGEALLAAKERIPHGSWGAWLTDHFQGSERTAQAYMRVAKRWEQLHGNPQAPADLTLEGALRLLAEPSQRTPAEKLDAWLDGLKAEAERIVAKRDEIKTEMERLPETVTPQNHCKVQNRLKSLGASLLYQERCLHAIHDQLTEFLELCEARIEELRA